MNSSQANLILGLPRRPRGENQSAGAVIGALLGFVLTENPGGAVLGGIAGHALSNHPMSLESAIRNYFLQHNLSVVFLYRSPKSVEVVFKSHNQFWTVKSSVPDLLNLGAEDVEDWIYGNLIKKELPKKLKQIQNSLKV